MSRFTHFSRHALKRVEQRSSQSYLEFAKILDCLMFVNIGREPGFNREHRLFYSIPDNSHFVAIQDTHTGGVVTILPPEYHENISWKIKESELSEAISIALNPPDEYRDYDKIKPVNVQPNTFIVAAHYNDAGGNQKTKEILKTKAKEYNWDISKLLKDRSLDGDIKRGITLKSVKSNLVWSISIRLGKNGERVYFSWIGSTLV